MWNLTLLNIPLPNNLVHPVRRHSYSACLSISSFHAFLFWFKLFADEKLFDRLRPKIIHADQLNAIAHHIGLGDSSQLNHPRAAHNLLWYAPLLPRLLPFSGLGGGPPTG